MAGLDALSQFVSDALIAGKTRDKIAAASQQAGWSAREVQDAPGAWEETPFLPPIPRPVATVLARDFFVYAFTFGVLLIGAFNVVIVLQLLIDLMFEDDSYGAVAGIRLGVSVLIVTVPLYLWLTYIALLLAAAILLGYLIATIYALMTGDLTLQFILKAVIISLIPRGYFSSISMR
jgi:hypothetical protein